MTDEQTSDRKLTFPCREPLCTQTVTYKRVTIPALDGEFMNDGFGMMRGSPTKKIVYLTCFFGHTHKYEINL